MEGLAEMSIGSEAPIGERFETGKAGLRDWLEGGGNAWRAEVGDDLLGGYATLHYPKQLDNEEGESNEHEWMESYPYLENIR
jgi:hypothetical protein